MTKTFQAIIMPDPSKNPDIVLNSIPSKELFRNPSDGNLYSKVTFQKTQNDLPLTFKLSKTPQNAYIDVGPEDTEFEVTSTFDKEIILYAVSVDVSGKTYKTEKIKLPYGYHVCSKSLFKKKLPGDYLYKLWVGKITETNFEFLENSTVPTYSFPLFTFSANPTPQ